MFIDYLLCARYLPRYVLKEPVFSSTVDERIGPTKSQKMQEPSHMIAMYHKGWTTWKSSVASAYKELRSWCQTSNLLCLLEHSCAPLRTSSPHPGIHFQLTAAQTPANLCSSSKCHQAKCQNQVKTSSSL